MIKSKKELKYYLECDRAALGKEYRRPKPVVDVIWKYQILMRKCSFYAYKRSSSHNPFYLLRSKVYNFRFLRLGQRLGFSIGYDSFGPGLALVHYGCTVVHGGAKIGENCRIHEGVTIGQTAERPEVPRIGNNVYIASGAKIIGNVQIADGVVIGAGAVVVRDVLEPGITVGGVPAKKISDNNSDAYIIKGTDVVSSKAR